MKRNWDKLYNTYVKTYNKKALRSKVGLEEIYNKDEFKAVYTALENTRKLEIKKGQRKVANITQDLIAKQEKYEYSLKQAKELKKALKETLNINYKIKDIRTGQFRSEEFWKLVKESKKELLLQGYNITEVNKMISGTFFGS